MEEIKIPVTPDDDGWRNRYTLRGIYYRLRIRIYYAIGKRRALLVGLIVGLLLPVAGWFFIWE